VAFATTLHFQFWHVSGRYLAGCNTTGCLYVTIQVAGHPSSVLSQGFHQSNFAILEIFSHTRAGSVLESAPETQLCFQVPPPPLTGLSTTVHFSLILQNATHIVCVRRQARASI